MIGYLFFFLLGVGFTLVFSGGFRRLRRDDQAAAPPEEDAAFDRRMEAIEREFGRDQDGTSRRG